MADVMTFPDDWHDFLQFYSFDDSEEIYTNGSRLIPVFRVEQLIEHLLKSQEPRVMTLSRVRNLKESMPVWLEDVDKKDVIGALFMRDYSGTKCVDFAIVRDWEFKRVVADYIDYGIRWRCWDKEPTDEQRKVAPWTQTNGL